MTLLPLHLVVNWPVFTILYLLFYYRDITSNVCSKDFEEGQSGHCRDTVIYGFENNSHRKWHHLRWNAGEHRSSKYFLGDAIPQKMSGQGER